MGRDGSGKAPGGQEAVTSAEWVSLTECVGYEVDFFVYM